MPADLMKLLLAVNRREPGAVDALATAVYDELRAMARKQLRGQEAGLTLQATAVANETFLRLLRQRQEYDSEGHFFAIASQQMRRVLLDHFRKRRAAKRGGSAAKVAIEMAEGVVSDRKHEVDLVALDEILGKLRQLDPRKAEVVDYRVFWGFSINETATALGVSRHTVDRDWSFARVWLAGELGETR